MESINNSSKRNNITPYRQAYKSFSKTDERITYIDIYRNKQTDTRIESLRIKSTDYEYDEKVELPIWNILNETDTMLGFNIQKAETVFRGKKWSAWFCLDIPYNFGPWKLENLPGLILKAEDCKGFFSWQAIGIEKPKDKAILKYSSKKKQALKGYVLLSFNPRKTTRKEIAKLWRRQWLAPHTISYLDNPNPEMNVMIIDNGKEKEMIIPINMSEMVNKYYPCLELDL